MSQMRLQPGTGYYDVTNYPLGGCFKRVPRAMNTGLVIGNVETIDGYSQYADRTGITEGGARVAFSSKYAYQI